MTDPTRQKSGKLKVMLRLDWNVGSTNLKGALLGGMPLAFDEIVYGPAKEPGSGWTAGTQYWSPAKGGKVAGFGLPLSDPDYYGNAFAQAGYANAFMVYDMSTATVAPDKTYAVTVGVVSSGILLYFLVAGALAGSSILPGFGLWNLDTKPKAWTYLTPIEFDGLWEITLLSPSSDVPMLLSIEYAPPRDYLGQNQLESRLVFTFRGGTVFGQNYGSSVDPLPHAPDDDEPVGFQYLQHRRGNAPYVLRNKDGTLLDEG
jgi:hypothetical protein